MTRPRSWPASILGSLIGLIGLVLAVGGIWLAVLGGSLYYFLTGVAMLVAGVLLFRGRVTGAWLYIAIFAVTLLWAFWEVGGNAWALVPRVVAPLVLLIATILIIPTLTQTRYRWRFAGVGAFGAVVLAAILFTFLGTRPRSVAMLPAASSNAMADPSGQATGADWPSYGGTGAARRYSALSQINPANVGKLERAWLFHTGDLPSARAEGTYGAETTPLKVGNTLYLCTPKNIMIALDPVTGKERWRFDPQVPDEAIPYTAACRGVVYATTTGASSNAACAARVIEGTLDARLIAVDARTGKPCSDFGTNGQTDTKIGMGKTPPGYVSITSPPTLVKGVLVVGHQILDGQNRWAPSGVIQGFDVVTGKLRWAWDMMHPEWDGYPPAGQEWARGTPNMWTMASGDEQLGLVYLPMGNASADYFSGSRRPQENQFATSLVALDVTTGKPRWRFQAVRKDVWDYDFGAQATLVDYKGVPALVLPSKQGDIYILNRATGRPLTPVGTIKAPGGGVEPAERAKTQSVSLWHTLRQPDLTERDMWGMSPIDQMICRIQFRSASYKGFFTPPTSERHSIEYPGYNGGTDWGGVAVDPARGVIVANYNDMPNYVRLVPRAEANKRGWAPRDQARGKIGGAEGAGDPQANTPYAINVNAGWRLPFTGMLCKQPPYGGIRAIDMATGKTIWDRPLGTARTNGPFGIPSMLPLTIGTPNNGGSVVTAGGVIFIAAATDNLIRAIDMRTGKTLWQDVLPGGGQATPMVYQGADGREYLVIMAGGHHFMETPVSDALVAYALPR
ncbi:MULTISPECIES: membrane-bound PQQ-dependent dehydrogenase, glucose/quinate/shikimate family [unclassified Sphingobium]|uniref:membrane-bound PQQ-dependent dehydrogenase, glucose/quinate/shikimate family n=1 Tax=unclassified Sphingobium TaxID=2611147 RepID=UPI000D16CFA1|nr:MULTISPECIES: membrane-bound PQQ-dependent dehydrogenase, glucose/quinate/shikimate family [unclassified Sphingobium]MBG6119857.1 quinoprotein glucose dehydrogenase [Sphingobium sp. JAI105]PSO10190.1 membrane-bound PQQ-dependent dehydrogenase, glucose/quinate/shikimate family [Sphingobium sp. AEW4]TWC98957.1 quinoprotein glucose dehydrogenase [Sphingobium sp. AEW010]TWD18484.1 quinoprotein glucose dehydrogenase [Sphingobium sp. AEW013]TWD21244.1 quinoprotein glucose dehydrogenase [Sphingobi